MTEEEYFRKYYPDSCYGDRPLSPHWDFFQDGVEFGERESEEKIAGLQHKVDVLQGYLDHDVEYDMDKKIQELEAQIEKMKIEWHDLEKDPNDLPKDYKTMCICLSDFGSKYEPVPRVCVGYCDSLGWSDYMGSSLYSTVRYWCELPKGR